VQCLVIERHFTDIQYGQPFVQFVIDILMMMTDDDCVVCGWWLGSLTWPELD